MKRETLQETTTLLYGLFLGLVFSLAIFSKSQKVAALSIILIGLVLMLKGIVELIEERNSK